VWGISVGAGGGDSGVSGGDSGAGFGDGKEDSTPMNADRKGMNADGLEWPVRPCVELDARASPWHAAFVFIPADRCSSVLSLACLPAPQPDRFLGGPLASGGDFLTGSDTRRL
jgi:hypothetical protein